MVFRFVFGSRRTQLLSSDAYADYLPPLLYIIDSTRILHEIYPAGNLHCHCINQYSLPLVFSIWLPKAGMTCHKQLLSCSNTNIFTFQTTNLILSNL